MALGSSRSFALGALGVVACVTLASCAAGAVMLNLLGTKFHARIDATATGEQQLAPRTRALLESAGKAGTEGGYRVVVATDLRGTDQRARTNLNDVLDAMHAFRPDFAGSVIDTGSPRGVEQFHALTRELYDRDRAQITAHLATLAKASDAAKALEQDLTGTLSPQLLKVRDAIPADAGPGASVRTYYENAAAALRVRAGDISRAIADSQQLAPQFVRHFATLARLATWRRVRPFCWRKSRRTSPISWRTRIMMGPLLTADSALSGWITVQHPMWPI